MNQIKGWINYLIENITYESSAIQTPYKEFSSNYNSKISFDIEPMILIQCTPTSDYTLYTVSSLYFCFSLIHDSAGLHAENHEILIKSIPYKTSEYVVLFKYNFNYEIHFNLSPFSIKEASIKYY